MNPHGSVVAEPELYDLLFQEDRGEIDYYLARTRPGEAILEFGIGTGRVALPLARAQRSVTGIDSSQRMLDVLQERLDAETLDVGTRISAYREDARSVRLGRKFSFVCAPFMMFNYLMTADDQLRFLESAKAHMADDATLVLELMTTATLPELFLNDGIARKVFRVNDEDNARVAEMSRVVRYDPSTQVVEQDRHFKRYIHSRLSEEQCVTWINRFCGFTELLLLLQIAGLRLQNVYGSHDRQGFTASSKYLIVECVQTISEQIGDAR